MIKLIIFDWDDVFTLGSIAGYLHCYHKALQRVGVALDPAEEKRRVFARWGRPVPEVFDGLLKEYPEKIDDAARAYEQALLGGTFVEHLSLVPGAVDLLQRLKDRYQLAIVSGIHPALFTDRILPRFNIPYVFSDMMSVYTLPRPEYARPHPYMAEQLLKRLGCRPNEAVVVGDAKTDVGMAKAAGIIPIVVLTGHLNRAAAEKLGVKYIIKDVTKLESVLDKIEKNK